MRNFWDWVLILLFGCLVFFHFRGLDLVSGKASPRDGVPPFLDPTPAGPDDARMLLLFVFDFQDFSCMTCLDSFLGLYQKLPLRFRTAHVWGVLTIKRTEGEEDRQIRIAEKKLRGFIEANQITSPFLVDRSRVFGELTETGSSVLLFDKKRKVILRFEFPLTGEQFEKIFAYLME